MWPKLIVSVLQIQSKETTKLKLMMFNHAGCGELQDVIPALLPTEKGLLQMQSNNNIAFQPSMEANTLDATRTWATTTPSLSTRCARTASTCSFCSSCSSSLRGQGSPLEPAHAPALQPRGRRRSQAD